MLFVNAADMNITLSQYALRRLAKPDGAEIIELDEAVLEEPHLDERGVMDEDEHHFSPAGLLPVSSAA